MSCCLADPPCALAEPASELDLRGVWPYWMSRPEGGESADAPQPGAAVANDVSMRDEVFVLSGPNMSGKSTLMRSVMAAALLGSVGLPVPARSAAVPQVRRDGLRAFKSVAGRSGQQHTPCRSTLPVQTHCPQPLTPHPVPVLPLPQLQRRLAPGQPLGLRARVPRDGGRLRARRASSGGRRCAAPPGLYRRVRVRCCSPLRATAERTAEP